jgi:hypothetical protein
MEPIDCGAHADMDVPHSLHQLTVVAILHKDSTFRLKMSMLVASYTLLALQLAGLIAMTYSTSKRGELEGLYGSARVAKLHQQEAEEVSHVRAMVWSDWGMLIIVNGVVAFHMQQELEEICFTDNWFRLEQPPDQLTKKPHAAYRFAIELLMAVRAFCLVSGVLAISPSRPLSASLTGQTQRIWRSTPSQPPSCSSSTTCCSTMALRASYWT